MQNHFNPPSNGVNPNVPIISGGKPNLFGGPPITGQGMMPEPPVAYNNTGKSKRDLLWEQKRKQKLDFINPPTQAMN